MTVIKIEIRLWSVARQAEAVHQRFSRRPTVASYQPSNGASALASSLTTVSQADGPRGPSCASLTSGLNAAELALGFARATGRSLPLARVAVAAWSRRPLAGEATGETTAEHELEEEMMAFAHGEAPTNTGIRSGADAGSAVVDCR